ncbi:hypothetical protein BH11MYX3_BH11MYX3_03120 [soil metagenome]
MHRSTYWLFATALFASLSLPRLADASCIPGFDYAAFGKNKVEIGGNSTTDSYDSSVGSYAATVSATTGGAVGTNGNGCSVVDLGGSSTTIGGNIQYGPSGTVCSVSGSGSPTVYGTKTPLTSSISMPSVTIPSTIGVAQGNLTASGVTTLTATPNNTWGAVNVGNGETLNLTTGTYIFDHMDVKGAVTVTGPVTVYLKCSTSTTAMTMNNGLLNPGTPQKSTNLVFMLGPTCATADFAGGSNSAFAVYGPDTAIDVHGNSDMFGAVVGKSLTLSGGIDIHYDKALGGATNGGFSCAATEISRSSPVVATISNTSAVVQGSFEKPSGTQATITTVASVATFTFPYIKGHMRARTAASISTTGTGFSGGTILFDAGASGKIPAASYSGCTATNGTCRHVFTNTNSAATLGTSWHPTTSVLSDGTSSAIGALIAPASVVTGIAAAQWQTIVRTVLDAKLGGVDRSTVAVIEPSVYAGVLTRPTIAYFGATDGMLHAVCASTGGRTPTYPSSDICPSLGTEIWSFLPRVQLPLIRSNTARVDGSVRVADVFGNFASSTATGTKSWHTILTFQTGFAIGSSAAVYSFDITDPANPILLWEYTAPSTPGSTELGTGLVMAMASPIIAGELKNITVAETNNGGTGGSGVVAVALSQELGTPLWKFGYLYPVSPGPRGIAADLVGMPVSGIPGGAVSIDVAGVGYISDFVMGDLYGNLWRLNAVDGTSRNGTGTPLFSFSTNKHPFGAPPAIYHSGGALYAAVASGGYADPTAASWTTTTQYLIAAKLSSTAATVSETATACSTSCALGIKATLTGERSFSQALVVGTQLFLTTDSTDINLASYGTSASSTGHLTTFDVVGGASTTAVITAGGSSLANSGSNLYSSSSSTQEQLTATATTTGDKVDLESTRTTSRVLWLRTN